VLYDDSLIWGYPLEKNLGKNILSLRATEQKTQIICGGFHETRISNTQFHAKDHENTWRKKAAAGRFQPFRFTLLLNRKMPGSAIVEAAGFGKSKAVTILNRLVQNGYITVVRTGRGTKYKAE
jgi:hypothetical protein